MKCLECGVAGLERSKMLCLSCVGGGNLEVELVVLVIVGGGPTVVYLILPESHVWLSMAHCCMKSTQSDTRALPSFTQ